MKPARPVLTLSAFFDGACGGALLFLPVEIGRAIGRTGDVELPFQLAAAGLVGFALLNWMGRGAVYGGIYGRPLVLANLLFATVTTSTLLRAVLDGLESGVWLLVGAFAAQAVAFGYLLVAPPWASDQGDG